MQKLPVGSHIKTFRLGYSHHGIYCGNGKVVHYSGFAQAFKKGALEVTTLEMFLGDETECYIVKYPSHKIKYSRSEIVDRAFSRVGEDSYNLAFNNCEHFATWCVTGRSESQQVQSVLTSTTIAAVSYHSTRTALTAKQVTELAASSAKFLSEATASKVAVGRLAGCATGAAIGGTALGTSGAALGTTALLGTTGAMSGTTALGFMATGVATAAAAPIALPALAVVGAGAVIGSFLGGFFD